MDHKERLPPSKQPLFDPHPTPRRLQNLQRDDSVLVVSRSPQYFTQSFRQGFAPVFPLHRVQPANKNTSALNCPHPPDAFGDSK